MNICESEVVCVCVVGCVWQVWKRALSAFYAFVNTKEKEIEKRRGNWYRTKIKNKLVQYTQKIQGKLRRIGRQMCVQTTFLFKFCVIWIITIIIIFCVQFASLNFFLFLFLYFELVHSEKVLFPFCRATAAVRSSHSECVE